MEYVLTLYTPKTTEAHRASEASLYTKFKELFHKHGTGPVPTNEKVRGSIGSRIKISNGVHIAVIHKHENY